MVEHPLHKSFNDAKAVAITLARKIEAESRVIPKDVQRFIDVFGK